MANAAVSRRHFPTFDYMIFKRISPAPGLEKIIACYWIIEDDDPTPQLQKIIPDGFCEIIFHYGDPYCIQLKRDWEIQSLSLLAGQIRQYFFLENTGISGVIGIKLQPAALTHLFNLDMHLFTDRVVPLPEALENRLQALEALLQATRDHEAVIRLLDEYFTSLLSTAGYTPNAADDAVQLIFSHKGMIPVKDITAQLGISERQLERLFKKYIGLSPKFYARIIRFSTIFQLIRENAPEWVGLAYEAGFYDQSHFIRNFKAFTGEDPSQYGFNEQNMANFFLKK
jgi:AraC-like DNA-binding protein